jgi:hypothetical protein
VKCEKPRRKGQSVGEFRQILGGIYYTAGKRTDHQKMKREEREEDAVSGKVEEEPGL